MSVTLILTRKPVKLFDDGRHKGRFGELVAVKGPKVSSVQKTEGGGAVGSVIPVQGGSLELTLDRGEIGEVKHFTTMERMEGYIQLHPTPSPYRINCEMGNHAVRKLRNGHDGRCFRIHGGKDRERGILIHEAPHVGWLIGCIGPRPLNNFKLHFHNTQGNPSFLAMGELFQFVGASGGDFFVLDW